MSLVGDRRVDPGLSRNRPRGNVGVLRIAVVVLFVVLGARLAQMQLVDGAEYAERSERNRIVVESVSPTRGLIYDRKGQPLVTNSGSFAAMITPSFLPESPADRYRLFLYLEDLLGVPALQIEETVTAAEERGQRDLPVPIARALDRPVALMLQQVAADLPGVTLSVEPRRDYPGGAEFSHILGYVGPQSPDEWRVLQEDGYAFNEAVGKVGVEARYEAVLRGIPGRAIREVDAQGDLVTTIESTEPEGGQGVLLSIDSDLQRYVYELLTNTMGEANTAAAVVMSPVTGEVYAIVSVPTYDNNIFSLPDPGEEYQRLLDDPRIPLLHQALSPVAPGSTFKIITAAAALEEGNITRYTQRNVDSTVLEFIGEDGQPYYFYDWRVHGELDLVGAISWSSNIYFYMASCGIPGEGIDGLGANIEQSAIVLGYYARSFGLGQVTGLDIASTESSGVIPSPEWKRRVRSGPLFNPEDRDWYLADTCFMGIGQGDVTATPLQIAVATAAIANGGDLLKPYVTRQVLAADGSVVSTTEPTRERVPVDEQHLAVIRQGMRQSVIDGAASRAALPDLLVAGKTGTAEFVDPEDGVTKERAWFTGFAPYHNPQVVVTVFYDLGVGGTKAAPIAADIIGFFMENVAP
ncbi:MAG: penicillin-binding protein 2 [Dehalococcoidia bacterium]|nr:penicillin-binding protein 2 [Dehalococcoidia bacterium]